MHPETPTVTIMKLYIPLSREAKQNKDTISSVFSIDTWDILFERHLGR